MKPHALAVVVCAFALWACATTRAATHEWWHGSISVTNTSSYAVHHLFLTPAHETHWGPDQLGRDVLETHETITLAGLDCADYDIKLVDHEGDACIVEDIDLCLQNTHWDLTDGQLAACTGFSK